MHENIGRSCLGSNPWDLSTQEHIHAWEHRSLLVWFKYMIFIDSNTHTCTRTSTATRWVQTPKIYKLKRTYMHENIGRSWLGSNTWYLSTQTHIHEREHRSLLVGLKPLIYIDICTHTCTRTSVALGWAQTPDMYRHKHTYMHENIGRSWLDSNPWYLLTQTHIHAREHRLLLVGLKSLICIDTNTHTCTRTSAAPCWAQSPDMYRHKHTHMHENIDRSLLGSNPWYLSTQTHIHERVHRPHLVGLKPTRGLFTTYVTKSATGKSERMLWCCYQLKHGKMCLPYKLFSGRFWSEEWSTHYNPKHSPLTHQKKNLTLFSMYKRYLIGKRYLVWFTTKQTQVTMQNS